MRARRPGRGQAAMTLLDCMVAIGLLTVGGTGLMAVHLAAMRAGIQARCIEKATRLAEEKMELLSHGITLPSSGHDTVDGAGCAGVRCTRSGQLYERHWRVGSGTPTPLQVTVSWSDGQGHAHAVVLDGLR